MIRWICIAVAVVGLLGTVFGVRSCLNDAADDLKQQGRDEVVAEIKNVTAEAFKNATQHNETVTIDWIDSQEAIRIHSENFTHEVLDAQSEDGFDLDMPYPAYLSDAVRLRAEEAQNRICSRYHGKASSVCTAGAASSAGSPGQVNTKKGN